MGWRTKRDQQWDSACSPPPTLQAKLVQDKISKLGRGDSVLDQTLDYANISSIHSPSYDSSHLELEV